MGVPIVTLAGHYAMARSGPSLLTSATLSDPIADSAVPFVEIATSLARDAHRLAEFRAGLRDRMMPRPLMEEPNFVRAFEAILLGAFHSALAGRP